MTKEHVATREVLVKIARFLGVVRVYAQDIQPKHELETDKPLHWKARELQDEVIKLIDTTPPAAQPAPVQEPVALRAALDEAEACFEAIGADGGKAATHAVNTISYIRSALYTTPPAAQRQWVGLTDEEIIQCTPNWGGTVEDVARAIEAKLKEKNNG